MLWSVKWAVPYATLSIAGAFLLHGTTWFACFPKPYTSLALIALISTTTENKVTWILLSFCSVPFLSNRIAIRWVLVGAVAVATAAAPDLSITCVSHSNNSSWRWCGLPHPRPPPMDNNSPLYRIMRRTISKVYRNMPIFIIISILNNIISSNILFERRQMLPTSRCYSKISACLA